MDCTGIKMCLPGGSNASNRSTYSKHKWMNCIIYQTTTTPDGYILALFGPHVSFRHDLTLVWQSRWEQQMENIFLINGRRFHIYGDSAYIMHPYMKVPNIQVAATPDQFTFNIIMFFVRMYVEWNYRGLKQHWETTDLPRKLIIPQLPI